MSPSSSAVDELAHLPDGAGIDEGVVDHQHQVAPVGLVDQPPACSEVAVIGFSTSTCLPAFSAAARDRNAIGRAWRWRPHRSRIVQQVVESWWSSIAGIALADRRQALRAQVANCDDPRSGRFRKITDEVRPPISVSDNADADHRICAEPAVEAMAMLTRMTARPIALRTDIGSRNTMIAPRLTMTNTKPTISG